MGGSDNGLRRRESAGEVEDASFEPESFILSAPDEGMSSCLDTVGFLFLVM